MSHQKVLALSLVLLAAIAALPGCGLVSKTPTVYFAADASDVERFAAAEVRRYLYRTTGKLAPLVAVGSLEEVKRPGILLDPKGRLAGAAVAADQLAGLGPEDYWLKTISVGGKRHLLIAGGSPLGTLYGAYAFVETLGVRFYLEGDVFPDTKAPFRMPDLDEKARPLFATRGIQPFHDFAEGPDWWTGDTYKTILGQLPKLRMNFFGLHTYPEKNPNAEPTVWIGGPDEFGPDGRVRASYPSSWQNTLRSNSWSHNWGYRPKPTSQFHFGAAGLFERDDFGPEVMAGRMPEPQTPEDSNALFDDAAAMLRGAFTLARRFGVRICVGTETPLTVPILVQERHLKAGRDPREPATIKELYKGMFGRIMAAYPIDTYWFWTTESWTWSDASDAAIKSVTTDLAMAVQAAEEVQAPFSLATCGWVLGPPSRRTLFDEVLPKALAVSTINREVGKAPVDPAFARISGRSKWAIPWMEDDPALTSPQLWAGRMRRDAVDALKYGCDGLLGIHWRTRVLSPNIAALAHSAWDQSWDTRPTDFANLVGPVNGQFASFPDRTIAGTGEEAVYKDIRDRVLGYRLSVPEGTYAVTLKFVESEFDRRNVRVFDVLVQGKRVAEKVDIFARAGRDKAYDLTFKDVAAPQGRLVIDFTDRIHYPSIAALVVEGTTAAGEAFVKRVNCGGPAVAGYEADWPETPRHLPALDFYRDWARNQFGPAAGEDAAGIFAGLDGKLPMPVQWTDGPGGIVPDPRPWASVAKAYGFVDALAAVQPKVLGAGAKDRFDYWLRTFEYHREIAHYRCLWGEYNAALEGVKKLGPAEEKAAAARETLVPARVKMIASLKALMGHLLATVSNTGELGTIANWEQHLLPPSIEKPGEELANLLGGPLPVEAEVPLVYEGPARIIVPTVRASLEADEALKLRVIVLGAGEADKVELFWRTMGAGAYVSVPLTNVGRSVFRVELPAPAADFEYYLKTNVGGKDVFYPAGAPAAAQTVVVIPGAVR